MPNETSGNNERSKEAKLNTRLRQLSPKQRALLEKRRKGNTAAIEATQSPLIPAADAPNEVPLTPVQQAYWIGRSSEFSMGSVAAFGYAEFDVEDLEMDQVEATWNRLIERHQALRTVITAEGRQKFLNPAPHYAIKVYDASCDSTEDRERHLDETRQSMSHQVMDCMQWPLFDVRATRLSDSRHRLHVGFDTIIVDARSFDILSNELDQLLEDPASELAPLRITFADYVNRSTQDLNALKTRARTYWISRLDALPPAPPLTQQHGAEGDSRRFARLQLDVPRCRWDRFCCIVGERQLTPSSVLLMTFAEVISHWSGVDDFTLNLTRFNRRPLHPDVENIVGCFTDLSLLEVNRRDAHTFEERAKALQARLWEDLDHSEFGATEIMRELSKRDGAMRLMPVVFTSALGGSREAGRGRLGKPVYAISQTPQVTIDCQVTESGAGVEIFWDYAKDAFPNGYVEAMFSQFRSIMEQTLTDDSVWGQYELVKTPAEHLSKRSNLETVDSFPGPDLLHALIDFSKSDATAVAGLDHALSYRALDARANAIAAKIQRAGVQYQDLVGVSIERGPDQIAAVLGVLRAGAAFVPLPPDLPPARLETLVQEAGIRVLVTGAERVAIKTLVGITTVCINGALPESEPVTAPCSPNDLAYVIFTSGTTGSPKGVMISHQSAVNTVRDMIDRFGLDRHDVFLGISDLAFDLSIFDIFGALAVGGTLVTTASDIRKKDPAHFHDLVERRQVTVWNSVPAIIGVYCDYLDAHKHKAPSLKTVFMSGDWIPTDLPERIFKFAPNAEVYSGGGATEASIWSVIHPIISVDPTWTSIPYG
ncbi:AMP-binding protein, partial [Roseovarius sp. M141]|uniref:AMP-binding protein n=1 Tax=Roseovarius sp. M141 TaxID=2583806 RepID=UPI0020CEB73D